MMEPTIHLRQAKAGDIPAILEIEQECFQEDSFSREQFVYLICRSKGTFYVVVEQERIIAYVSLLFHAGTRYLRIYSIAVHPDCRGRKLGQLLMERTIETALECKAAKITKQAVKDLGLPKGATIGGLIRNGEGILVTGYADCLVLDDDCVTFHGFSF